MIGVSDNPSRRYHRGYFPFSLGGTLAECHSSLILANILETTPQKESTQTQKGEREKDEGGYNNGNIDKST